MVIIERPCCDTPLAVELPLVDALRCEDCAVSWTVADPEAAPVVPPPTPPSPPDPGGRRRACLGATIAGMDHPGGAAADDARLRAAICAAGRRLGARGLISAGEGNLSLRLGGGAPAHDPDRTAQGRAGPGRPRDRPAGPGGRPARQRPSPELGYRHPPGHLPGEAGRRGDRPCAPAGVDGPQPRRGDPGPRRPARDGPFTCRSSRSCRTGRWAARSSPHGSPRRSLRPSRRSPAR